jgi:hypothetical protein
MHDPSKQSELSDDNKENEKLKKRPRISIRMTITISYALFFILCIAITIWSFWTISTLEDKIKFLEITDNYLSEIQQARRFEKNYLLYGTNLDDAMEHLANSKKSCPPTKKPLKKSWGKRIFKPSPIICEDIKNNWSGLKIPRRKETERISSRCFGSMAERWYPLQWSLLKRNAAPYSIC